MPAPSPVFPSASTAPLCQMAFNASIPSSTTFLLGFPSIETTIPTPHDACSKFSRYMLFSFIHDRLSASLVAQFLSIFCISISFGANLRPLVFGSNSIIYSAAITDWSVLKSAIIASAASLPSRMAQTTSDAPLTMSPTA